MASAGGQPSEVSDCKSPSSCRCCWLGPAALGGGCRQEDSPPALWALRPLVLVPVKKAPPDKRAEWLWQEKPQKVVRSAVWLLWSDGRNGGGGRRSQPCEPRRQPGLLPASAGGPGCGRPSSSQLHLSAAGRGAFLPPPLASSAPTKLGERVWGSLECRLQTAERGKGKRWTLAEQGSCGGGERSCINLHGWWSPGERAGGPGAAGRGQWGLWTWGQQTAREMLSASLEKGRLGEEPGGAGVVSNKWGTMRELRANRSEEWNLNRGKGREKTPGEPRVPHSCAPWGGVKEDGAGPKASRGPCGSG